MNVALTVIVADIWNHVVDIRVSVALCSANPPAFIYSCWIMDSYLHNYHKSRHSVLLFI
jgi:hypothetical protein